MSPKASASISAETEWGPLRAVVVGRAENSCFPSESMHMIQATMPQKHHKHFKERHRFPDDIVQLASRELDHFVSVLEKEGIRVYRPDDVDWHAVGGYTGAMPRDGLFVIGNTLIEACFAWNCRRSEIDLAFSRLLHELGADESVRIVRAPARPNPDTLYDSIEDGHCELGEGKHQWAINNTRPAFDAADFMKFGKTVIGQLSHVTNQKGVEYLQQALPERYRIELLQTHDPCAMHIDATILPLRWRLLVFNPERVSEEALRRHAVFAGWELRAYPFVPSGRGGASGGTSSTSTGPPLYMTSPWTVLNVLSLDDKRVVIEAEDTEFAAFLKELGMEPIICSFRHVKSLGGSFHCATIDLVRDD